MKYISDPYWGEDDDSGVIPLKTIVDHADVVVLLRVKSVVQPQSRFVVEVERLYKGQCEPVFSIDWTKDFLWASTHPPRVGDRIWLWWSGKECPTVYIVGVLRESDAGVVLEIGTPLAPYRFTDLESIRLTGDELNLYPGDDTISFYPWREYELYVEKLCGIHQA